MTPNLYGVLSDGGILLLCIMNFVYRGHTSLLCTRTLPPAFTLTLYVLRFCIAVSVHVFRPGVLVLNMYCVTTECSWTECSFLHAKRSGTYTNHWALKGLNQYVG